MTGWAGRFMRGLDATPPSEQVLIRAHELEVLSLWNELWLPAGLDSRAAKRIGGVRRTAAHAVVADDVHSARPFLKNDSSRTFRILARNLDSNAERFISKEVLRYTLIDLGLIGRAVVRSTTVNGLGADGPKPPIQRVFGSGSSEGDEDHPTQDDKPLTPLHHTAFLVYAYNLHHLRPGLARPWPAALQSLRNLGSSITLRGNRMRRRAL